MDLIDVVGGLGVASLGRQGLELKGLCTRSAPARHQTAPEAIAACGGGEGWRPQSRDGRQAVGGRPELLSQALRVEEPGQLLVLVEPIA